MLGLKHGGVRSLGMAQGSCLGRESSSSVLSKEDVRNPWNMPLMTGRVEVENKGKKLAGEWERTGARNSKPHGRSNGSPTPEGALLQTAAKCC